MLRDYYWLLKPGIIYGNALNTAGAFLLAARGTIDFTLFFSTLGGLSLIVASGCVFNNIIDRDIDALMERTKKRALVRGVIPLSQAYGIGFTLGMLGAFILYMYTNALALLLAGVGFFAYVFIYSFWSKRYTLHSTLLGAISGAMPPLVGYCAVRGEIDTGAVLIFLILSAWQFPHALSIAIYRLKDYTAAKVPVLPVSRGVRFTKKYILVTSALLTLLVPLLTFFGYTGFIYLGVMLSLCIYATFVSIQGFYSKDDVAWGRRLFLLSVAIIFAFSVLIAFDFQ